MRSCNRATERMRDVESQRIPWGERRGSDLGGGAVGGGAHAEL
jgi:hypothetical protein